MSPVGKPCDTLEGVIGIRPEVVLWQSMATYRQVELLEDLGTFDYPAIEKANNRKQNW